jgi:hypothetical protein
MYYVYTPQIKCRRHARRPARRTAPSAGHRGARPDVSAGSGPTRCKNPTSTAIGLPAFFAGHRGVNLRPRRTPALPGARISRITLPDCGTAGSRSRFRLPSRLRMIYNIKMEVRTSSSSRVPGPGAPHCAPRRRSRSALSFTATLPPGHLAHHARAGNTVAETVLRAVLARVWRARSNCYPINTASREFFESRLTTVALSNSPVAESRTIVQPRCVSHSMGTPGRTRPMGQPRRTQHGQ